MFADYFLTNWDQRRQPVAFLLYDPPPALPANSVVFIHSDKQLRLVGRFLGSEFVAAHKFTAEAEEREAERERVWLAYRAKTLTPPTKADFDRFWIGQNGVRGLFLMDNVNAVPEPMPFKVYGRALEWGYPTGVGYRYLSLSQVFLLLRLACLPEERERLFLNLLIGNWDDKTEEEFSSGAFRPSRCASAESRRIRMLSQVGTTIEEGKNRGAPQLSPVGGVCMTSGFP